MGIGEDRLILTDHTRTRFKITGKIPHLVHHRWFNIRDSFKLTGRGLVAMGDLLEGSVRVGSVVTFVPVQPKK
jgi:hypothetical protein